MSLHVAAEHAPHGALLGAVVLQRGRGAKMRKHLVILSARKRAFLKRLELVNKNVQEVTRERPRDRACRVAGPVLKLDAGNVAVFRVPDDVQV